MRRGREPERKHLSRGDKEPEITERKQAAEANNQIEGRYRGLFEGVPVGLYSNTPTGQILDANPEFLRILGYPNRDTLAAVNIADLFVDPEVRKEADLLLERRRVADFEAQMRKRDGSVIWVRDTVRAVRSAGGIWHHEGAIRDITERKQADEVRRRLAAIVESSDDAIYRRTMDGTIQSWNPGAEKMFGYAAEEVINRHVSITYPPDRLSEMSHIRETLSRGEHLTHFETVRVKKDGTRIDVSLTISPIKDEAGKLTGTSAIARDITERRRAEEALRKSEERFRLVARAADDAVWDWDLMTNQVWWGEGVQTLFGYPKEVVRPGMELRGENIHPEDRERVIVGLRAAIHGGEQWVDEYRFRRADGTYAHVFDRGYVIRDPAGNPLRMIGAMVDMTGRKQAQEALWKAIEAERANQAKNEFLSRMSHELRTPLNAILGFAQLLEMDPLNEEQRENVDHILQAGQHLLELINEVLDITRIETGRLTISLEPVPLTAVVQEVLDLIKPLATKVNVRLDAAMMGAPERRLLADRQRIRQVLLNLLSNAVKYNREGGAVTLSYAETSRGRLRIKVSDTGPGILPDRMDRLFTPFERLGAEQTGVEGTGLGLALSKRLVEAMGGTLGVESTVGRGSTFWVECALVEDGARHRDPDSRAGG